MVILMKKEELFEISRKNIEWLEKNYETLKRKYDNRWIVIHNREVVETSSTFNEIMNAVKKHDPNSVIVEYMQRKPIAMFF